MKKETKARTHLALMNAATLIIQQAGIEVEPEYFNEVDLKGLIEYEKACRRASKLIETLAKKYE